MSAGSLQLGNDVGNGFAHAGDFGEPAFGNQHLERDGEGGQTIRRARVGLRPDKDCRRATRFAAHIREAD
jgi:hypothetical protein